jgi:ABC-type amino acid transport substrate-binding protein
MNQFLPLLTWLPMLFLSCNCVAASWVLRAAAQESAAPKFLDSAPSSGHCPDILSAIEAVDGSIRFVVDPTPTPLKRIEKAVKEGRLDVMCALLDTPLRRQIAQPLPTPVYWVRERLVGLRGDQSPINSLDDLARAGGLVATQAGAIYAQNMRQHGISVDETDTISALNNIVRHRVRYYYGNELTCAYYIKAAHLESELTLMPAILAQTRSYFWVGRHVDAELLKRLNTALSKLKHSGTLDRIYKTYAETN